MATIYVSAEIGRLNPAPGAAASFAVDVQRAIDSAASYASNFGPSRSQALASIGAPTEWVVELPDGAAAGARYILAVALGSSTARYGWKTSVR